MILREQQFIKALLLLSLALFLFSRIAGGTLDYYISHRYAPYTLAAVLVLLLLVVGYVLARRASRVREQGSTQCDDAHHEHDHHHEHEHEHEHHEHHRLSWSGALIVLAPVVLGLLVVPQPLGAPALDNRDLSPNVQSSAMPAAVRRAADKPTQEYNLLDWYYSLRAEESAGKLDGAEADIIGFVYHDPALGEDAFWLARFSVSCCVADATAMSMLVHWPNASSLAENQWVRVTGHINAAKRDSRNLHTLEAASVEPAPEPDQPYLYP